MNPVPRLWPGETVAILAGGPSLTQAQVDACRGRARVIAIKDTIRLAAWADALYACDGKWWKHYGKTLGVLCARRYALDALDASASAQFATVLRNTGETGLELDPTGLRTGRNSGYQAINLAVHLGATRIVLLGYDMQPAHNGQHHWFREPRPGSYSQAPIPYASFLHLFPTIVAPLAAVGVTVLNATPESALTIFPTVDLEQALEPVAA